MLVPPQPAKNIFGATVTALYLYLKKCVRACTRSLNNPNSPNTLYRAPHHDPLREAALEVRVREESQHAFRVGARKGPYDDAPVKMCPRVKPSRGPAPGNATEQLAWIIPPSRRYWRELTHLCRMIRGHQARGRFVPRACHINVGAGLGQ